MEHSIQSRTDGIAFRRPTFNRNMRRFFSRVMRGLESYGRAKAAKTLARHGHHSVAKNLLEGSWR